jgi:signal transduction histidine kinase/DNA-binding response OmpR family regulator
VRAVVRLVAALVLLTIVPLALLTYFSLSLAGRAVESEVEKRLDATAAIGAVTVREELLGLTELVESYATRPTLQAAFARNDRQGVVFHLRELRTARPGIFTAFATDLDGRLLDIVPATPAIVGDDFSFRDWYRGVKRTRGSYISEAYATRATGEQLVVASATYVRTPSGRPIGILVGAYSLEHLQQFSDQIARVEDAKLRIVDQRGNLVAAPGGVRRLVSFRRDPRVAAALAGRSGIGEFDTVDGKRISAYTPVPDLGWVVTASVPADTAFAAISGLRSAVVTIAGLLGVVLLGALALFARALRQRARAEREAVELAAINSAVLDSTIDAIMMTDLDGNVLLRNAALQELTSELGESEGDSPAERLAAAAARTTDPAGFARALDGLTHDREKRLMYEFELADVRRSFALFSAPVASREGKPIGRILSLHEVTREREADRMKSDLLATVSHELRTPLTGVLGFAELARRPDLDAATRDRYLTTIHGEARRLTALVNDFLDLQRMEAGAFTLALEPLDLRDLLRAETELFEARSDAHTVELELPSDPLPISGDRERLVQVLENLLSNAIKFSPAGGKVRLAAESLPGFVRVSVSDEGLGIPADQQGQLFTKFFRVDTSDTRRIGGTGLGLALCREIVESHAGEIGFETVQGAGSTFWFTLPTGSRREASGSNRVLVIEDDPTAAAFLVESLSADGFEVETATTGDEGLRRALEDPPAVICLDMFLPNGIQGWEVLERVKIDPRTAHVPVVVCTGRNNKDRAAALGASDFLAKPLSPEQLREAVRRVVRPPACVLVVDDDPTVRRLVAETLSRDGLEVIEAADGEGGLEAVAARRPDVIVLDLIMPGVDGLAVLEQLQDDDETRTIPVIVLTARRLSAEERRSISQRVTALLGKTEYSAEELRRLVAQSIGADS